MVSLKQGSRFLAPYTLSISPYSSTGSHQTCSLTQDLRVFLTSLSLGLFTYQLEQIIKTSWAAGGIQWEYQVALVVKSPPANAGDIRDASSIPELGRSSGEGNGNTLQYSRLENPMDRLILDCFFGMEFPFLPLCSSSSLASQLPKLNF